MSYPANPSGHDPFRRLCAAIIKTAWQDAQGRDEADQAWALAWLASSRATEFFDEVEIDQGRWLMASGWRDLAAEVLDSPPPSSDPRHLKVISRSAAHLAKLHRRRQEGLAASREVQRSHRARRPRSPFTP